MRACMFANAYTSIFICAKNALMFAIVYILSSICSQYVVSLFLNRMSFEPAVIEVHHSLETLLHISPEFRKYYGNDTVCMTV